MKQKQLTKILILVLISVVFITSVIFCCARFVFLSPLCFSDNVNLTEQENYFIKKIVLETVADRLSVFSDTTDPLVDDQKHLFILINSDFMDSVIKTETGYFVSVKPFGIEYFSNDWTYEVRITKDFQITSFGLDA